MMNAEEVTGSRHSTDAMVVHHDTANEAASHIADLSKQPHQHSHIVNDTKHTVALQEDPDLLLLKAQLDLLKYLVNKAQTATDKHLIKHRASENLRTHSERITAASQLIARIESEDYMSDPEDQDELQHWMNDLVLTYAGDSDTDERIARVIAVERSVGLRGEG